MTKTPLARIAIALSMSVVALGAAACVEEDADSFDTPDSEPSRMLPPLEVTEESAPPILDRPIYCPQALRAPNGLDSPFGHGISSEEVHAKNQATDQARAECGLYGGCNFFTPMHCEKVGQGADAVHHCWTCAHPITDLPACDRSHERAPTAEYTRFAAVDVHNGNGSHPYADLHLAHVDACGRMSLCSEDLLCDDYQPNPNSHLDEWGWYQAVVCSLTVCVPSPSDCDGPDCLPDDPGGGHIEPCDLAANEAMPAFDCIRDCGGNPWTDEQGVTRCGL